MPSWGAGDQELVVTLIARLVPIKRVDRFLAVARQLAARANVRFVVVGDGELREELASSDDAARLGERLVWAGFRRDIPDVCFASDVVMLTSDNEGTPVSLIEAQAAAVPVVATDVGGVRSVVHDGEGGRWRRRRRPGPGRRGRPGCSTNLNCGRRWAPPAAQTSRRSTR